MCTQSQYLELTILIEAEAMAHFFKVFKCAEHLNTDTSEQKDGRDSQNIQSTGGQSLLIKHSQLEPSGLPQSGLLWCGHILAQLT
mmetsp:Transcript_36191/g.77180  ORF Transcript_36191/g.77180 Transcript_36191/m.77180 type:complete len:85 (-) Transcript_36191:110-364(-)